ncbi:MAG: phytanoyl-CoA dioxygenase family protein [Hyphomicrobiales bacterium]|nr:phytanoyl-CoA dioxygenase family protein [Hyphomicrobiales bacterium]
MKLSPSQLAEFDENGFVLLPDVFSAREVAILNEARQAVFAEQTDANIIEKKSGEVRTAMGLHLRHEVFARLVRHPRLVGPAQQILGDGLYVQQVKINVKSAFDGEAWQWHYDFATHHADDGVPEPLALNIHVFMEDVNEFNGPLYFITGSHKHGAARTHHDTTSTSYPLWCVDTDVVAGLIAKGGLVSAKGKAGSVLIFGDILVHGSPPNMSPWDRPIFSLILNTIANKQTSFARPDYKHHTDFTPVTALDDDCLMDHGRQPG